MTRKTSCDSPLKAAVVTIGCRLNQNDTAFIHDRLTKAGCVVMHPEDDVNFDILILNTCAVTATACQKSRQALRQLRKKAPDAFIIVTGCSTDVDKEFWEKDDVADAVVFNENKKLIGDIVQDYVERHAVDPALLKDHTADGFSEIFYEKANALFPFKTRAALKVQDGCNSFCSYCIVPYARGRERSRDWNEIMADFNNMLEAGAREIVVTGVNISTYNYNGKRISELLEKLVSVNGDFRIRLSSMEPHAENYHILEIMRDSDKICRFLHIPLQNGSDHILKLMNRKYLTQAYYEFAMKAKEMIPGLHLGTDLIVGFPGEKDGHFNETMEFVRKTDFANMHIFTFSPRAGTPAKDFPDKVSAAVARERYGRLNALKQEMAAAFAEAQIGKTLAVLPESFKDGVITGFSDNYLKVRVKTGNSDMHSIVKCKIIQRFQDGSLKAEL